MRVCIGCATSGRRWAQRTGAQRSGRFPGRWAISLVETFTLSAPFGWPAAVVARPRLPRCPRQAGWALGHSPSNSGCGWGVGGWLGGETSEFHVSAQPQPQRGGGAQPIKQDAMHARLEACHTRHPPPSPRRCSSAQPGATDRSYSLASQPSSRPKLKPVIKHICIGPTHPASLPPAHHTPIPPHISCGGRPWKISSAGSPPLCCARAIRARRRTWRAGAQAFSGGGLGH